MDTVSGLVKIINSSCNYKTINAFSGVNLRNRQKGLNIMDVIYYRFLYSDKNTTKQQIVSKINEFNNTSFSRQAYESKENNIPISFYENLLNRIIVYFNAQNTFNNNDICVAVDGTYNNNNNCDIMLNMGLFDVTNQIPISLNLIGKKDRNNEVRVFTDYLTSHKDQFKNTIFICDRLYFCYNFLYFLQTNGFRYIIRAKKDASNLNPSNHLKKNTQKYNIINELRKSIRVIKCKNTFTKTVNVCKSKRKKNVVTFEANNDCVVITNIVDSEKYSDQYIVNKYRSRWDIEVYFKLLKSNFKYQNLKEKNPIKYKKMYYCELILTYIMRLIENDYCKKNHIPKNDKHIKNINRSNLIKGIFNSLLYNIIHNKINKDTMDRFYKSHIIIQRNDKDRSFSRVSKTPFTKWYIKGYSEMTQYNKIINAILNNTTDKLNKNLKLISNRIISINGKSCKTNT